MTDIVDRLRYIADTDDARFAEIDNDFREAADEIERLRKKVEEEGRRRAAQTIRAERAEAALATARRDALLEAAKECDEGSECGDYYSHKVRALAEKERT